MKRPVLANLAWLFGERLALTALVFVSNIVVIRTLGAERFGALALFQVWLALTLTGTEFGLRRVVLALGRARAFGLVLAATVRIKLVVGALLATTIAAAIALLEAPPESWLLLAVALCAPLEAWVYHFEAKLRNDLLARIRIGLVLAMASARIALCLAGFGIPALAATYVLPGIALGLICRRLARREPRQAAGAVREAAVRGHVLQRAGFFFASVLLLQLHARADQLLLAALAGPAELGLYAGAFKFVEQLMMLPAMLTAVLLPALSRRGAAETAQRLVQVYFATALLSLGLAVAFAAAAAPLVALVLGPGFAPSGEVLAVLAWGLPGLFLANVSGLYYSLNGLERWAFVRNLLGLAVGVALGLLLIPRHGAIGAAWSMVASYALVAFGVEWFGAPLRRNVQLKARALAGLISPRRYLALLAAIGGTRVHS